MVEEYNFLCMLQNQTPYSKTIVISRSLYYGQNSFKSSSCVLKQNSTMYRVHSTTKSQSHAGPHSNHTNFTAAKWPSSLLPSGADSLPPWHHWQYQGWEYRQEPPDVGSRGQVGCLDCRCQVLDSHTLHWETHLFLWSGIAEEKQQ